MFFYVPFEAYQGNTDVPTVLSGSTGVAKLESDVGLSPFETVLSRYIRKRVNSLS